MLLYGVISDRHADTEELLQGRSNIVVESFDHRQNTMNRKGIQRLFEQYLDLVFLL